VIAEMRYPVHMLTKSDLVLRDLDLLKQINEVFAIVSFTLTTADDDLAAILEPHAPLPSARLRAMQTLVENGISCGVMLMPILPFIEDTPENITGIVEATHQHGGSYILPAMALTLRDRQREYYFEKLDEHYPGLSDKYRQAYGESYQNVPPNIRALEKHLTSLCRQFHIPLRVPRYTPPAQPQQMALF
jgi:DNA repair photolyase